ncbi:olfactory receptor 10AG1-like [Leptodactylus fuscus]|uniref:olfactory receptor 10AG1-like n=1 Tax=Leptodactylus fuscus TaxID=238119 RepID=UPI003F4F2C7F
MPTMGQIQIFAVASCVFLGLLVISTQSNGSFVADLMGITIHTNFTEFILLGFSDFSPLSQAWLFTFFVTAYILSLIGNSLIILAVTLDPLLDTPMYFFLRNLSLIELCTTNVVIPKVLELFLFVEKTMSFVGCIAQMFVFFSLAVSECLLLMVMAFDRYLAICYPLRYMSIISTKLCHQFICGSWTIGSLVSLGQTTFIFTLTYCRSNLIAHFFCDIPPLLSLACTNTFMNKISVFTACFCGATLPLLLILCSYINILSSILHIRSTEGQHKALSTCGSHLMSVLLYYGTAMFMYLRLGSETSRNNDRMIALFYCLIIPTINPFIYSLRNKDMKKAIWRLIRKISGVFSQSC